MKHIEKAILLSDELIKLANDGYDDCEEDDRLLAFLGIILDTGWKIRRAAENILKESNT
jgi:hypothetical protein